MTMERLGGNEWIDEGFPEHGLESKIEQIPIEVDPQDADILDCMREIFEIADKVQEMIDEPTKAEKLEEISNFLDRLSEPLKPSPDEIREFRDKISAWK